MDALDAKLAALRRELAGTGGVMAAFSGGADSAFLLAAAGQALGHRAVAATGVSPSLAEAELADARALATELGVRHLVVATHEGEPPPNGGSRPPCQVRVWGPTPRRPPCQARAWARHSAGTARQGPSPGESDGPRPE